MVKASEINEEVQFCRSIGCATPYLDWIIHDVVDSWIDYRGSYRFFDEDHFRELAIKALSGNWKNVKPEFNVTSFFIHILKAYEKDTYIRARKNLRQGSKAP